MDFLKFSFTSEEGYLRQRFIKFLQQLNNYSEDGVVLKLVDDFLASH